MNKSYPKLNTINLTKIFSCESMDTDLNCVFEGLGAIGALYISNAKTANNLSVLHKLNIKAVVTAAKGRRIEFPAIQIPRYIYLEIEDHQKFPIEKYFEETFRFIDQARRFSNVLIHCHAGASRSVAIVIAYLIRKFQYSLPQIYAIIKRKRSRIEPNPGFIKQLQKYAQKYVIHHSSLYLSIQKIKPKCKRSLSLGSATKSSMLEETQNNRLIKSEMLNKINTKRNEQQNLFEEEKQKIAYLHKQREEIEGKLKSLRHGLIRGGNLKRSKVKDVQAEKVQVQDQDGVGLGKAGCMQNSDPNQFHLVRKKSLIQQMNSSIRQHPKLVRTSTFTF